MGLWLSRVALSSRNRACGYLEWIYRPESESVAIKSWSIVQKVGLSRGWVCGYEEWVYRPESGSVAIKSGSFVQKVGLWLPRVGLFAIK